jgi:plastocyanin
MKRFPIVLLSAAAIALGIAACGGSSSSSSSSAAPASSTSSASSSTAAPAAKSTASGGALTIAANPTGMLMFTKSSLTAKAGTVTIAFTNSSSLGHNLTIQQGTSGPVVGSTPTFSGGVKMLTVKLKPGKYTFYCSVPGHRAGGMQGTLTVT